VTPFTVLLVEDDPAQREEMADLIRAWGYRLDTAADGREALALALAHRYGVIVMDIHLPGPSGIEIVRRLVLRQPDAAVVFLSDDPACLREAAADPGLALIALPKPVRAGLLEATLGVLGETVG